MSVAELLKLIVPELLLTYDAEHGWRLVPAPPEWWWEEMEA